MNESGNTYNNPTRKCARAVGDILGKYHPHEMCIRDRGWSMVLTEAMQHGVVPVAFDSFLATGVVLDEGLSLIHI